MVLVALVLPVLLIIVGFSVDLALLQCARTDMRAVADLSAKAAVGALSRTQEMAQARAAARDVASNNTVASAPVTLDDPDIVFGRSVRQNNGKWTFQSGATPLNSVSIRVRRANSGSNGPIGLFFGRFYGRPTLEHEVAAAASFLDVDVCLVLDRSSSMKLSTSNMDGLMSGGDPRMCQPPLADSRWVAVEDAVSEFISHLSTTLAIEHVALVTFASNYTSSCGETSAEATVDQDLASNLTLVTQAMATRSSTVWNGMTNIDAGMRAGRGVLTGAASRPLATKVMVVLTDGVYTGADPLAEATAARNADIIVHTITFGSGANQADMLAVAQEANGNHYHAPDASSLPSIFTEISGWISILTQ